MHGPQAALFSAVVTAFLIRAPDDLEPDYQRQSAPLLHQLLNGCDPEPTHHPRARQAAAALNSASLRPLALNPSGAHSNKHKAALDVNHDPFP